MSNASASQIKTQIELLDAAIIAERESFQSLLGFGLITPKLQQEHDAKIRRLSQGLAYWRSEYRKKGGTAKIEKAKTVDQLERDHSEKEARKHESLAQEQHDIDMKNELEFTFRKELARQRMRYNELMNEIEKGKNNSRENWLTEIPKAMAGGAGAITHFVGVEAHAKRHALKNLNHAQSLLNLGRVREAHVAFETAAKDLDSNFLALGAYHKAVELGKDRIKMAAMIGASIGVATVSAGYSLTWKAQAIMEMGGAAGVNAAAAGFRLANGEPTTKADLLEAFISTATAGGGVYAGHVGKTILAGPIQKVLAKKGVEISIEAAERLAESFCTANAGQVIEYAKKSLEGKEFEYNLIAGLVTPIVTGAAATVGNESGKAMSEKEVRNILQGKFTPPMVNVK